MSSYVIEVHYQDEDHPLTWALTPGVDRQTGEKIAHTIARAVAEAQPRWASFDDPIRGLRVDPALFVRAECVEVG